MNQDLLRGYIESQNPDNLNDWGVVMFKPGFSESDCGEFRNFCEQNQLTIIKQIDGVRLSTESTLALYPKIFSSQPNDLVYGLYWKQQVIDYLISDEVRFYIVEGENCQTLLNNFKHNIRDKYGKIKYPEQALSDQDFLEIVVKNIVHVVDEHEIQNALWLL